MTNTIRLKSSGPCLDKTEMQLTPLEKYAAWNIIRNEHGVLRMGKYFYIGMKQPAPMPSAWWEVDCHLGTPEKDSRRIGT